jgi:hypothetical protein
VTAAPAPLATAPVASQASPANLSPRTSVRRVLTVSYDFGSRANTHWTYEYENGPLTCTNRNALDAETQRSTTGFTLAVWGSGVRVPLAPRAFTQLRADFLSARFRHAATQWNQDAHPPYLSSALALGVLGCPGRG